MINLIIDYVKPILERNNLKIGIFRRSLGRVRYKVGHTDLTFDTGSLILDIHLFSQVLTLRQWLNDSLIHRVS